MTSQHLDNTKRVFHIDQECFIIFAEELSSKKERFLRIGNSPFLKEFGQGLTFITLLTSLYPGNPFKELDIFRPNIDRKIIGLTTVVNKFVEFLKTGGIETDNIVKVYAEDPENKGKNIQKKSEEQFLEELRYDRRRVKHSFAAFYNDGNIRVFNRAENIFDLKDWLGKIVSEKKEISLKTDYFRKYYLETYKKDGFIISDKSIFVYSNNNFACITGNQDWVKDAIRVGITPGSIKFLYVTEGVYPDSLWLKTFIDNGSSNEKIKLVLREKDPLWLKLISDDIFDPLYPERDTIDVKLNNIRLMFQNKRIYIIYNNIKYSLDGEKGFLENENHFLVEYIGLDETKSSFEMKIDYYDKDALPILKYHPLVFEKKINDDDSINNIVKNLSANQRPSIKIEGKSDGEIIKKYISSETKNSIDSLLYFVMLQTDFNCGHYLSLDKSIECSGKVINECGILLEQRIGFNNENKTIIVRDRVISTDFIKFKDEVDPFLIFEKDFEVDALKDKMRQLGDYIEEMKEKNLIDENKPEILKAQELFENMVSRKEVFAEQREKLKSFFTVVETIEKKKEEIIKREKVQEIDTLINKEEHVKGGDSENKTIDKNNVEKISNGNDNNNQEKDNLVLKKAPETITTDNIDVKKKSVENRNTENTLDIEQNQNISAEKKSSRIALPSKSSHFNIKQVNGRRNKSDHTKKGNIKFDVSKRFKILILLLIVLLLLFGGVLLLKNIKIPSHLNNFRFNLFNQISKITQNKEQSEINNQSDFEELIENKYVEESKASVKSYYYKFFMTNLDKLNITNMIAVQNGYHKIVYRYQKKNYSNKDPDWIFPGENIKFSDGTSHLVKKGDTLWSICEEFLIRTVNKNELEIRSIIEQTKRKLISIDEAKKRFEIVKEATYSEMIKLFLTVLMRQKDFEQWEPYLDEVKHEIE